MADFKHYWSTITLEASMIYGYRYDTGYADVSEQE